MVPEPPWLLLQLLSMCVFALLLALWILTLCSLCTGSWISSTIVVGVTLSVRVRKLHIVDIWTPFHWTPSLEHHSLFAHLQSRLHCK